MHAGTDVSGDAKRPARAEGEHRRVADVGGGADAERAGGDAERSAEADVVAGESEDADAVLAENSAAGKLAREGGGGVVVPDADRPAAELDRPVARNRA